MDSILVNNVLIQCVTAIQAYWWIAVCLLTIFLFIVRITVGCIFINSKAKENIKSLIEKRKYVPKLYVELGNSHENIRYFIYGKKWRKRVKKEFVDLINSIKPELKKYYPQSILFKNNLTIKQALSVFNQSESSNIECEKYPELKYVIKNAYFVNKRLEEIQEREKLSQSQFLLLTGSAGNGKTNLLCKIAELLIKKRKKTVFVESRSISGDITQFILNQMNVPDIIKKRNSTLKIYLFIRRPFIIIDAINENDLDNFAHNLFNSLDWFVSNKTKVIVSSRKEYFKERFASAIEEIRNKPLILEKDEYFYSDDTTRKLLAKYSEVFNTPIPNEMISSELIKSLLLLRIYFETNENNSAICESLYRHVLYQKYIDKCLKNHDEKTQHVLSNYLKKLPDIMFKENIYDEVPMELITSDFNEISVIRKFSDDNLLTSRKISKNKDSLTATEVETIFFPFDELRDYCLARHISFQNPQSINDINVFFKSMNKGYKSPLEGTLHYLYIDLKSKNEQKICKDIVNTYFKEEISFLNSQYFNDYGLSIIFDLNLPILDFEKDYLEYVLLKKPYTNEFLNVVYFLYHQEKQQLNFKLNLIMDIIYSKKTIDDLKNILSPINLGKNAMQSPYYPDRVNNEIMLSILYRLNYSLSKNICLDFIEITYISIAIFPKNKRELYFLVGFDKEINIINAIEAKTSSLQLVEELANLKKIPVKRNIDKKTLLKKIQSKVSFYEKF